METTHTKGPWVVNNNAYTQVHGLDCSEVYRPLNDEGEGEWIAYVRGNSVEERIANAQLIAAAPELLSCLIEWLETSGIDPFDTNTQGYSKQATKAINAILKATTP